MKSGHGSSSSSAAGSSRAQRVSSSSSSKSKGKSIAVETGSIVVFSLSVFLLIALISYHPNDPSLFTNSTGAALNACGRVGAFFASFVLQCFGLGAFLVPAAFFFIAMAIHKREGSVRLFGTLGGMAVAVMAFTVFLTLQWKFWPYAGSLLLTGGAVGAWFAELLTHDFNSTGSSIVSLVVFCLALVLSTPISVAQFGARVLAWVGRWGWKLGRVLGTYFLYLAGLLGMRMAHAAGDLLQKLIEKGIHRARERAHAAAQAIARARQKGDEVEVQSEAADPSGPVALPAPAVAAAAAKAKTAAVAPVIGVPGTQLKLDDALDDEEEDEAEDAEEVSEGDDGEPAVDLEPVDCDEESAIDVSQFKRQISKTDSVAQIAKAIREPKILPREHVSNGGTDEPVIGKASEAASKVAQKLKSVGKSRRGAWKLPTIEFLRKVPKVESTIDREKLIANSQILKQKFADFGIDGDVTAVRPGPVITLYEFKPGPGVKVSRIASLADDLSMALSAQSVRILAPLPGKSVVGIEIPSDQRETVYMREFLQHQDFFGPKHSIPVVMGKDISGQTYLSDLARMPHLLCAGQTGSGKSVFMNGLICSLLYRFTPDELRLILVDPKFIEFRAYQDIPHLLLPVVDDPKHASIALKWAVREMERRYRILAKMEARNLASFNQKVESMGAEVVRDLLFSEENQEPEQKAMSGGDWAEAFEPDENGTPRVGKLPYIVVIIDELADLMMIAKKEVEVSIARIAQKARAAGIHLVIATQRPSTDVVTGLIKANLPSRVSFQLASYVDSKTILDRAGAERLLGQGDMLFIPPGVSQSLRLHGAYVDDDEISKVTSFLKDQGKPAYRDEILLSEEEEDGEDGESGEDADDEMFGDAVDLVKRSGHASASFLQRHLKVGYNRAARMIETMESRGIVGPADGARPREVLIR